MVKPFLHEIAESRNLREEDGFSRNLNQEPEMQPEPQSVSGFDYIDSGSNFNDMEELTSAAAINPHIDRPKRIGDEYFTNSKQQMNPEQAELLLKIARKYYDLAKFISQQDLDGLNEAYEAIKNGKPLNELSVRTLGSYIKKGAKSLKDIPDSKKRDKRKESMKKASDKLKDKAPSEFGVRKTKVSENVNPEMQRQIDLITKLNAQLVIAKERLLKTQQMQLAKTKRNAAAGNVDNQNPLGI